VSEPACDFPVETPGMQECVCVIARIKVPARHRCTMPARSGHCRWSGLVTTSGRESNSCLSSTTDCRWVFAVFTVRSANATHSSTRFSLCCYTLLLCPRQWLRSIVMSRSVCVSVCLSARISPEPHVRSLPNFLCMSPMSMACWR